MKKNLTIVMDADALVSQANKNDINHRTAIFLSKLINTENAKVIYPASAIMETITVLHRQGKGDIAVETAHTLTQQGINVENINNETIKEALLCFSPKGSKKNTIFDCTVAAVAKKHNADAIFSFDKFYKKLGFKLLSELSIH